MGILFTILMGILFTILMGFLFTITMGFLFTMVLGIQLTISTFTYMSFSVGQRAIVHGARKKGYL